MYFYVRKSKHTSSPPPICSPARHDSFDHFTCHEWMTFTSASRCWILKARLSARVYWDIQPTSCSHVEEIDFGRTTLGPPNKLEVDCLLAALRVASFHVPVATFQTGAMPSRVDANDIRPLLSVVKEVTVCGNSVQASNSVIYRNSWIWSCTPSARWWVSAMYFITWSWVIEQFGLDPQLYWRRTLQWVACSR